MAAVRKAVIPAAGFGTRFLPFTKAVPKELIPLVDKPVIQYVVEEAVAAGIEEILIVVSAGKEAIMRHFNPNFELESRLERDGKTAFLEELRAVDHLAHIHYVYQQQLNGLGDAVLQAADFVGDSPFAVLLGDTVMDSSTGCSVTAQLTEVFSGHQAPVVALEKPPREKLRKYGVVGGKEIAPGVLSIQALVEKPEPGKEPGDLAVAARYVFTPAIFDALRRTPRGVGNELQLTDAMQLLLKSGPMFGRRIEGRRFDLGSKLGFIAANAEFGLRREEFREQLAAQLQTLLAQQKA